MSVPRSPAPKLPVVLSRVQALLCGPKAPVVIWSCLAGQGFSPCSFLLGAWTLPHPFSNLGPQNCPA